MIIRGPIHKGCSAKKPPMRFFRKIRAPQKKPQSLGFFWERCKSGGFFLPNPYFAQTRCEPNCLFRTRDKYFARNYYFFEIEFSSLSSGCSEKNPIDKGSAKKNPTRLGGFFCGTLTSRNFTENAGFFLRNTLYRRNEVRTELSLSNA